MKRGEHFYAVDVLRGLSAIGILIYHYPTFFTAPLGAAPLEVTLPGNSLLWPIYWYGLFAVQLFWLISGFVFAHVYAGSAIGAKEFAIKRFARLYPLHFLTLMVVLALQGTSIGLTGSTQVIGNFDLYHFLANAVFITPDWGYGYSFNSPIWSVTIEEIIYAVFFSICSFLFLKKLTIPIMLALFCLVTAIEGERANLYALCGLYFFCGTIIYYIVTRLSRHWPIVVGATTTFSIALTVCLFSIDGWAKTPLFFLFPLGIFPPILVCAALLDELKIARDKIQKMKWIGDLTYSTYLWHFPVQVGVLILLNVLAIDRAPLTSVPALLVWIGTMICVGRASFLLIEKPAQKAMLRLMLNGQSAAVPQGAAS